jgi:valyl-tRNA synthetase
LVAQGRALKSTFNIPSNKPAIFTLQHQPNPIHSFTFEIPKEEQAKIKMMLGASSLVIDPNYQPLRTDSPTLTAFGPLYLSLEGLIDVEAERARLTKELTKATDELGKVRAKLADENFTSKVPQKVLDEHKAREADWAEKLSKVQTMMEALS